MYKSLVFIGVSLSLYGVSGQLMAADTGDAPASYGEATHAIVEGSPWLGNLPADDNMPFGDETALADDQDGLDDEGGVFAFAPLVQNGKSYMTNVFATNLSAQPATLVSWIDFDGNGRFDADEGVVLTVPPRTIDEKFRAIWPDLTGISSDYFGPSYARYRISTDPLTVDDAQGPASDGEVEDFRLEILADSDGDERPDSIDPDNDNDGIPDTVEGTDVDTDSDGLTNNLDVDSDGDSVPDYIEAGPNPLTPTDADDDGIPDYLDSDSDNDGVLDSEPLSGDADQDGIADALEGPADQDADSDGVLNSDDIDSDNDTIPDAIERGDDAEAPVDTDGDGIPDFLDLDSDNDGIPDIREANTGELNVSDIDMDNDGRVDNTQITGVNGYADVAETAPDSGVPIFAVGDSDADGVRDFQDLDSDNDGVFDIVESLGTDIDSNGVVDSTLDANQDGLVDDANAVSNGAALPDTDGDFIPDFQDGDANGSDPVVDTGETPDGGTGTPGGETPDGETPDGGTGTPGAETPDGETPDGGTGTPGGETPDGETPDGGTGTPGGETPDGETPDGGTGTPGAETPDGETPDGGAGTPGGESPDGETPDGGAGTPGGETPDGETPDGEAPDGETPQDDDQSAGSSGEIQTGLSGGAGCSVYSARQLEAGKVAFDPALPLWVLLSALPLMLRRKLGLGKAD